MKTLERLFRPMRYALVLILLSERAAHADIGVPMIFVTLPSMVIALLPVILVEAFILGRKLGVAPAIVLKAVAVANIVSTLVGIPLTWLLLVLMEMLTGGGSAYGIETTKERFLAVTWQAPWLIPYQDQELKWMIPAATLVLLVPFFFASWLIETMVARKFLSESEPLSVKRGMLAANGASYLLLGLLVLSWLLMAARQH